MRGWGDLRLVPAAVAAWSASLAVDATGVRAGGWVAAAWLVTAAAGALLRRGGAVLALAAVAAAVALATASASAHARAWIGSDAAAGGVELSGRVEEARPVVGTDERVTVRIRVDRWRPLGAGWRAGAGLVIVIVDADAAPGRSSVVAVRGSVEPSVRGADGFADGDVVTVEPPTGWRGAVEAARDALGRSLLGAPATTAPVVTGMVLGDTSAMPPDLVAAMRVSGLAHLTAVSGAHFAILAAAMGVALRRVRAGPVTVALGTVAASVALAAAVTGGGSVLRALVMAVITGAALVAGRRSQVMPALAAAVIVLLVVSPELARDAGLVLSVSAVAAIALLTPALSMRLRRVVAAPLADAAAVTLAAQCACLPMLAVIEADVGPWAVAANAVAAPWAVPVTVLGVAALALGPLAPAVAVPLAEAAAWSAWPVVIAARAFAQAPGAGLRWPTGARGIVLGLALVIAVTLAARGLGRVAVVGALAGTAITLAAMVPPRLLPPALGGPLREWSVVACDVGQGDALVVRGGGAVVMVDAGPPGDAAAACLRRLGVARVDLLVLTHEHADHTGGTATVAQEAAVVRVWLPPAPSATTVTAAGPEAVDAPPAGTEVRFGGVTVEVLQSGPPPHSRDGTEVNDSSTALRLIADGLTVIALGDLEQDGQRRLHDAMHSARADVVKVAHHGSAVQDTALARALRAPVALFSAGEGNDYGHPSHEALALYGEAGATVLRTDLCGDIVIAARDGAPVVLACRGAVAG